MPAPMPNIAGWRTAPDTTHCLPAGTLIDVLSSGIGKPTPSVEKIHLSTRGVLRKAPAAAPPGGSTTNGVTTRR